MSAHKYALSADGTWAVPVHKLEALRAKLKRMRPRPHVEEHLGVDAYHVAWRSALHNGAMRLRTPVRLVNADKVRVGAACPKHGRTDSDCDKCKAADKWRDVMGTAEGLRDAG